MIQFSYNRLRAMIAAGFILLSGLFASAQGASRSAALSVITIDGQGSGRVFDGIGAISANSASRLLYDYPGPERSQILDYLFKPNYGAGLQMLKVEIGCDDNTTFGTEPSHMRWPGDLNGERGYEWWLMKEAKARNPEIKLWGLEWCAPSWFKGGFWSQNNIDYLLAWMRLAQKQGLSIDYMGGWNEAGFDVPWYIAWHKALAENFPRVKIVGDDGKDPDTWTVAHKVLDDPAFRDAVDIIGVHDLCRGARNRYENCPVPEAAEKTGKKLWDSELCAEGHDVGAGPMARALNRSYIDGRVTGNMAFTLASAFYPELPLADTGLLLAANPWSGHYDVGKNIWVLAHTAQFTRIGWQYIDKSSGYLTNHTSYVSLKSPDGRDFTSIIETMDAHDSQLVRFEIRGGLSSDAVQVWSTDLTSGNSSNYFVHLDTIRPTKGEFTFLLQPGHIYTLSTTTGQRKGEAQPAASAAEQMPLPYLEDFESYAGPGKPARYFSDYEGAFETAPCGGGRTGWCYRQVITKRPITWNDYLGVVPNAPFMTIMGDVRWWGDYEVDADAMLEQPGYVELMGRVSIERLDQAAGYHLRVTSDGQWALYSEELKQPDVTLASGSVAFSVGAWHRLGLRMLGPNIEVLFDGATVGRALDTRHLTGKIALAVSQGQNAQFDNISIAKTGPWPGFVSHAEMQASATSEHGSYQGGGYDYLARNAIDDRPETAWSAEWRPAPTLPQSITLDLGHSRRIDGLVYQPLLPRIWGAIMQSNKEGYIPVPDPPLPANKNYNAGYITEYRVWLSNDGKTFAPVVHGTWPADCSTKMAEWPSRQARYVRLEAIQAVDGMPMAGEINIATTSLTTEPSTK